MEGLKAYAVDQLTGQIPGLRVLIEGGAPHILPITISTRPARMVRIPRMIIFILFIPPQP